MERGKKTKALDDLHAPAGLTKPPAGKQRQKPYVAATAAAPATAFGSIRSGSALASARAPAETLSKLTLHQNCQSTEVANGPLRSLDDNYRGNGDGGGDHHNAAVAALRRKSLGRTPLASLFVVVDVVATISINFEVSAIERLLFFAIRLPSFTVEISRGSLFLNFKFSSEISNKVMKFRQASNKISRLEFAP